MSECGASPAGGNWPVCSKPEGHDGWHESADYQWLTGDWRAQLKSFIQTMRGLPTK